MKLKEFIKNHQLKITLLIGYFLVFGLAFGLGRLTVFRYSAPEIRVEEVFSAPSNNSQNSSLTQSTEGSTGALDCQGKIKGSSSLIYHIPGGAFYAKTTKPIRCFDTEAEAKTAGFRKSLR